MEPLFVVLDLDETLVYASSSVLARPPEFWAASYAVYRRPHLGRFLTELLTAYRVGIWTASNRAYAEIVLQGLSLAPSSIEFLWCTEKCTERFDPDTKEVYKIKNLRKVRARGISLSRVVAVDDSSRVYERNYGNLLQALPFLGAEDDDELPRLLAYIHGLAVQPDVRTVDKRGWRRGTDAA